MIIKDAYICPVHLDFKTLRFISSRTTFS